MITASLTNGLTVDLVEQHITAFQKVINNTHGERDFNVFTSDGRTWELKNVREYNRVEDEWRSWNERVNPRA